MEWNGEVVCGEHTLSTNTPCTNWQVIALFPTPPPPNTTTLNSFKGILQENTTTKKGISPKSIKSTLAWEKFSWRRFQVFFFCEAV
jgi:hypothetical protein